MKSRPGGWWVSLKRLELPPNNERCSKIGRKTSVFEENTLYNENNENALYKT